jgi:hypothetical protein
MVADNFLCSAAVALFWFTNLRARLGHAWTTIHRGRYPPDRISRPYMSRKCVGPASTVYLHRSVENTFTHLFIRTCSDSGWSFGSTDWKCPQVYLGIFSGRARKKPDKKMPAQARPDPTVEPEISAQAQPVESFFCRAVGLSGRAFLKSSNFLAQARPS